MFPHANMMAALGTVNEVLTWDPSAKDSNVSLSAGNKIATETGAGSAAPGVRSLQLSSGKVYVELQIVSDVSGANTSVGIANASAALSGTGFVGADANALGWRDGGQVFKGGSQVATFATYGTGDLLGIAYDSSTTNVWFSKNGVWQSGNPATGAGGLTCSLGSTVYVQYQGASVQTPNDSCRLANVYTYGIPNGFSPV